MFVLRGISFDVRHYSQASHLNSFLLCYASRKHGPLPFWLFSVTLTLTEGQKFAQEYLIYLLVHLTADHAGEIHSDAMSE